MIRPVVGVSLLTLHGAQIARNRGCTGNVPRACGSISSVMLRISAITTVCKSPRNSPFVILTFDANQLGVLVTDNHIHIT